MKIDITDEEILADLSWPGPPPGRWSVPAQLRELDADRDQVGPGERLGRVPDIGQWGGVGIRNLENVHAIVANAGRFQGRWLWLGHWRGAVRPSRRDEAKEAAKSSKHSSALAHEQLLYERDEIPKPIDCA